MVGISINLDSFMRFEMFIVGRHKVKIMLKTRSHESFIHKTNGLNSSIEREYNGIPSSLIIINMHSYFVYLPYQMKYYKEWCWYKKIIGSYGPTTLKNNYSRHSSTLCNIDCSLFYHINVLRDTMLKLIVCSIYSTSVFLKITSLKM